MFAVRTVVCSTDSDKTVTDRNSALFKSVTGITPLAMEIGTG
jgi:hypothetical protein